MAQKKLQDMRDETRFEDFEKAEDIIVEEFEEALNAKFATLDNKYFREKATCHDSRR